MTYNNYEFANKKPNMVIKGHPLILLLTSIFIIICLLNCDKENLDEESEKELLGIPSARIIEQKQIITSLDTLRFSVENPENLSKILLVFSGMENHLQYSFEISEAPYILVIDPTLFKSNDYMITVSVESVVDNKTYLCSQYSTAIFNPNEEVVLIGPHVEKDFDRVWIVVEDSLSNVLSYSRIDVDSNNWIEIPEDKRTGIRCYNLHFIFEMDQPPSDDGYVLASDITIESYYHFKGRSFSPKQFPQMGYGIYSFDFRFENIPAHDEFNVLRPYLLKVPANPEEKWRSFFTTLEPQLYVYTRTGSQYLYKYIPIMHKTDTLIDLSDMKPVTNFATLEANGTAPDVLVCWLKDNTSNVPRVNLFKKASENSTVFTIPMPEEINNKPIYLSEIGFGDETDIRHNYQYIGKIPQVINQLNVDFSATVNTKTIEITTQDDFDFIMGKALFFGKGMAYWNFVSDTKKVSLPDFPVELCEIIPVLSKLKEEGNFHWKSTTSLVRYSNFVDYQTLLNHFDVSRFEPTDLGEYELLTFSKRVVYDY